MEAIQQATVAKGTILGIMGDTLPQPRPQHDPSKEHILPQVSSIPVPPHKRSRVMGPGGSHIRRIQQETGVQVLGVS